ncbi:hypothetical protein CJU80_15125 [Pseudomonas fragi]|nr:oligosaccharide flippase family protein [Pseudomonas sp. CCC4.1]MDY7570447.1 oligosaccharide flippase family protein [Pseudomonas sp. CCC4.1]MEB0141737.1 oligosaccharide flippase family protein [Pseudomonas sp. CCC4.1]PAA39354.1 hypothetical protein CJU80_15125 [Pseudomonas fragi]
MSRSQGVMTKMRLQFKNVSLLLVAQLVSYLIPILEIPILAKALGVDQYGQVLIIQTTALLCSLIVEYGFSLSGARQVAVCGPENKSLLSAIYNGVNSAKLLLSSGMIAVSMGVLSILDFDLDLQLILWGYLYFLAFSFSNIWLFQGLEKLTFVVTFELVLRFAGLLVLYLLLNVSANASFALMIMSSFSLFNTLVGLYLAYKIVGGFNIDFKSGVEQIKSGFHGFIYKSSNNIMLSAGPALVGVMCGQASVAKFVPAEKIIKASVGLVGPVLIGLYPYLSRRLLKTTSINLKLSSFIVAFLFAAGVAGATIIYALGDFLINLMLGPGFDEAKSILQVFVMIIPFRMMNQAIGLTIFMPLGKDKILSMCLMFFSLLSLCLAALFSLWYDLAGIVYGLVLAEVLFSISLILLAYKIK